MILFFTMILLLNGQLFAKYRRWRAKIYTRRKESNHQVVVLLLDLPMLF